MTDIFIPDLLVVAIEAKASDLHIVAGRPPMMRINGHVVPMNETILTPDDCQEMIFGLLSDKRKAIGFWSDD